jgi:molybdate transport system substrate-binding protein
MMSKKLKMIALCALPFASLSSNNALAANPSIKIAVAANFNSTLGTLIGAYQILHPSTTIVPVSNSSGVLYNTITGAAGGLAGYTRGNSFDLFFSADKQRPDNLVNLPANAGLTVSGSEWLYAVGELELWSPIANGQPGNVTAGLAYPLTQNIAVANPSTAPYGTAAATVLNTMSGGVIHFPALTGTTYPAGAPFVNIFPNISITKQQINAAGAIKQGFIHQSAICILSGGVKTFNSGSHHTYPWNDPTYPHAEIAQYAVKLINTARPAGSTSDLLLTDFLNYMNSTAGQNTIKNACYSLTL